jgi:regulatory protein YycI of two-component signal transduction system YycFG
MEWSKAKTILLVLLILLNLFLLIGILLHVCQLHPE